MGPVTGGGSGSGVGARLYSLCLTDDMIWTNHLLSTTINTDSPGERPDEMMTKE